MVFLLLITTFTFAKSITILSHYCVDDTLKLKADFFGAKETFEVITISKTRSTFTVPSLHVKNSFEKNGYEIVDSPTGTVTFERFCNLAGKKEDIAEAVLMEFENQYPCIDTDLPEIKTSSPLPYDFKTYELIKVELKQSVLRKRSGSFKAIFQTPTKEKSIYFKFNIDAYVDVFKAKHKLYNDRILSKNDYEKLSVKIDKLPSKVITCKMPKNLMTKNYISANSFLTMNKFEHKKDVLRGTDIKAYIRDGMLVLETKSTVLKDANVGDTIRIKTDKGKLFRAKLISKYEAIILE